jgi:hypothetical protein
LHATGPMRQWPLRASSSCARLPISSSDVPLWASSGPGHYACNRNAYFPKWCWPSSRWARSASSRS